MKKLTIIGGGITGLVTAYIAAKNGYKTTVIEASPHMGGLLNTFEIQGTRLEFFYHHFFTHDAELHWLCKELGISDKLRYHTGTMDVYRNGKLYNFNGPLDLLKYKPLSFMDKLRFGFTSLYLGKVAKWQNLEHVAAIDWFRKYAGKNVTDNIWEPMLKVKFGPYMNEIPIAWMAGRLAQRMNSRKQTEEKLGYVEGSLQVLLDALLAKLQEMNVSLVTNAKVTAVETEMNTLKKIITTQGDFTGGLFISTIPTIYLASLLEKENPSYSNQLKQIKYFGAVCTILETENKLSDTYWINVADPGYPFGGVIEHTNLIPSSYYNGSHITYLSRYFTWDDKLAKASNQEIEKIMVPSLKKMFPKLKTSDIKKVYVFKTLTAAPVCDLNFSQKVPKCRTPINNLFLSAMPHIYPDERSCNNSIRIAAESCRVMGMDASFVPKHASLSGQIGMD